LGKFGKFWAIGPREYGTHATNSGLRVMNEFWIMGFGQLLNRYGFWRTVGQKGYYGMRPMKWTPLYSFGMFFAFMLHPFYWVDDIRQDANDT